MPAGARQAARNPAGGHPVFASVAISGIIASLSKNMIGHARPSALNPPEVLAFDPMLFRAAYASFPSDHATPCIALALSLGVIWLRHRTAFLIVGMWGALSRTMIGTHWFSDVVAGGILGAVVARWLRDRLWRRTV
ncbi:MAG: phosphatase PAP2 family protein [Paracoccus sp. (in: a-proteobacteria)]|nr:phosphatase PAP2 family protein [Paracoccus sp. (in: a-proteobacteria)]